jgi:phospholipid-binding lipoprotein MlaA
MKEAQQMNRKYGTGWLWVFLAAALVAAPGTSAQELSFEDEYADEPATPDPLEPLNRVIYHVNDKLYFWIMKPVTTGYEKVMPNPVRSGLRNMFDNVGMPKRFVNCVLQGRVRASGSELARFGINSTIGILGWRDVAGDKWKLKEHVEDTGQTFGVWGVGPGICVTLPIFGPSNARDAVGLVGDVFLDPIHYLPHFWLRTSLNVEKRVNGLSFALGEYERGKATALDHYVSLRDMYQQYRERQVRR